MPTLKYLIENIPFEIEHEIVLRWNTLFKRRLSSAPFLSGDTYRAIANFIYDNSYSCHAKDINEFKTKRPIVFISAARLEEFVNSILPDIINPFILITHQSDTNITMDLKWQTIANNKYIFHWFAQNCTLEHSKVTPLPIGLEDAWRHNTGALKDYKKSFFRQYSRIIQNKKTEVLLGFSLGTNPDSRFACYRAFWRNPILHEIYTSPNAHLYRKLLEKSMFVASPSGNGLDCHRTWEAMYMGTIPLVEDNYMNRYFASLGLPLICISDWREVANWDENKCKQIYDDTMQKSNTDALKLDYWISLFNRQ